MLSRGVLDSRLRGCGFKPHQCHHVLGCKESYQNWWGWGSCIYMLILREVCPQMYSSDNIFDNIYILKAIL